MTALAAETSRRTRDEDQNWVGIGTVKTSVTIYKGAMVMIVESTGRLTNAAATAAHSDVVGIATETAIGNTGGTVKCEYMFGHAERIATKTALTRAFITTEALVADNDTATTTAVGTAGVRIGIGIIEEFDGAGGSGGFCWIRIGIHARKSIP